MEELLNESYAEKAERERLNEREERIRNLKEQLQNSPDADPELVATWKEQLTAFEKEEQEENK